MGMALDDQIATRLYALDYEGLADMYRPDALVDINVPQWRYQLQGPDAIRELLREALDQTGGEGRVTAWRATPTDDGLAVEMEVRFPHDGEEQQWREVHLFHTDGASIVEHVCYCTGIWDAATIARQAIEAPMVRR